MPTRSRKCKCLTVNTDLQHCALQAADLRTVLQSHGARSEDAGRPDRHARGGEVQSGGKLAHLASPFFCADRTLSLHQLGGATREPLIHKSEELIKRTSGPLMSARPNQLNALQE